jgi:membrane-bound serine protease (ClpP class)
MVDKNVEVPGVVAKGDLLNVGGDQAVKLGLADVTATSVEDALAQLGYVPVSTTVLEPSIAEDVAGLLSGSPVLAVVLLVIGLVGIIVEIMTPGFGVPGAIGVISLALFFGGRLIAGLAGWESVVLFVVGFLLLLIEVFAIPGFGIAGVSGIVMIFVAIGSAFASWYEALIVIGASIVISIIGLVLLARYLSRFEAWGRFVLKTRATAEDGYVSGPNKEDLIGAIGETVTMLRPAGVVRIDDKRIDAVSEGVFLPAGVLVQVIDISGNRVVVRKKDQT